MTKATAKRLFLYDRWANRRILDALCQLPVLSPQDRHARLFSHLLRAQETWLRRVRGEPLPYQDFWPVLDPATWSDVLDANHADWAFFLEASSTDMSASYAYRNSKGLAYETAFGDIVQHLIIHGQHHRAQIAALLRTDGIAPPATDFIYFTRDDAAGHGPG